MILPLSVVKQADLSRTGSIILEVCFLAFETKLRLLRCRENLDLKNLDDVRVAILQYKKKKNCDHDDSDETRDFISYYQ